ncbi:MAG: hypothetical protein Ct9H90mP16_04290 [Candidatus Poseidoniales archaeon]|nr:MAG: hypothetical protein Ct9H90mP16_04290 [Candidatus Poseidoniales archaeon]
MSLTADVIRLVAGMLVGMVLPRLPLLFFTRFLSMERELPPHPDPVPISVPLIQRLLLMRRVHLMCWITALLPLGLGLWILQNSPEPFALGMVQAFLGSPLREWCPRTLNKAWVFFLFP